MVCYLHRINRTCDDVIRLRGCLSKELGVVEKKKRIRKGIATHYAYLGGGPHPRRVTKLFNLDKAGIGKRRALIHELIHREGECLSILPDQFKVDCDLDQLERFLEGEL